MKKLQLFIEYQCPQCGASATLAETDRLFTCEFCRVKSYLLPLDSFLRGKRQKHYPVTYPVREAMGTLKIILANFISSKSIKYRKLDEIIIEPKSHIFIYVPFADKHLELIQPFFNLSILKSQLYYDKKE